MNAKGYNSFHPDNAEPRLHSSGPHRDIGRLGWHGLFLCLFFLGGSKDI